MKQNLMKIRFLRPVKLWQRVLFVPLLLCVNACLSFASAENADLNFYDAIRMAVRENPEVNREWYRFEAARAAERAAKGLLLPDVNLVAEKGDQERTTPQTVFGKYETQSNLLSINQLLFDGFRTQRLAKEKEYEYYSQYYQLRVTSEEVGLEAAQAYFDTYRHQQFVTYAIENLLEHREVFLRIQARGQGVLDPGVDIEQASARLSLAESNLLVEVNNLNDLKTRYQRTIGVAPADDLVFPETKLKLPVDRDIALDMAFQHSPLISLTAETSRARQQGMKANMGNFMPTFELRYRKQQDDNREGVIGRFEEEALEVAMSLNLYRGGQDKARSREAHNLYYTAVEIQKNACRIVRRDLLEAYNEVTILTQRLAILKRNKASQERSKEAYKAQFLRGDLELLNLLDSQNEYFETQRAYMGVQVDLAIAEMKTLTAIGLFLDAVGVADAHQEEIDALNLEIIANSQRTDNWDCTTDIPEVAVIDIAALYAKVDREFKVDADLEFEGDGGFGGDGRYIDTIEADPFEVVLEPAIEGIEILVYYETDSKEIPIEFDPQIQAVARKLFEHPNAKALIEGYADEAGQRTYNRELSVARATGIKKRLEQHFAIDPERIEVIGFGEDRPASVKPDERGNNRRAVIIVE